VSVRRELICELVAMGRVQAAGNLIPIEDPQPDPRDANGNTVLFRRDENCAPPATAPMKLFDSQLR
jgi:hypothetical protein